MEFEAAFTKPPVGYGPLPFWFLNDALHEDELRRQLDDFHARGVAGVVLHPRIGLPEDTPFMGERWLEFASVCVDHAASLAMKVVLYDEGMYPSGSAAGRVVAADPRHATRCLERRPKGATLAADEVLVHEDDAFWYVNSRSGGHIRGVHWGTDDGDPGAPPSGDLLNPDAVASFIRHVHERYHEALGEHFGGAIIAMFTDEPDVLGRGPKRGVVPWTWGFDNYLRNIYGRDFRPYLPALFDAEHPEHAKRRAQLDRAVARRLEETYYAACGEWCERHGIALTGHPAGPDDIGTLRHFHIPGQDIVWRWVEPFNANAIEGPQSTQAKCAASAQRHCGRARNANECFGAFGWGFTENEMWWLTNWLLIRGTNMLFPHAFYYSVRGARRGERPPDVGPNNAWWPRYGAYAHYVARLCWLLAESQPVIDIAVLGAPTHLPWRAARVLFENQRDFLYLDTDALAGRARITAEGAAVGGMTYAAIIADGPEAYTDEVRRQLEPLTEAGRLIAYGEPLPSAAHAATHDDLLAKLNSLVAPDARLSPSAPNVRAHHVRREDGDYYLFATEGRDAVDADLDVAADGARQWWDPAVGKPLDEPGDRLRLEPFRIKVLRCHDE